MCYHDLSIEVVSLSKRDWTTILFVNRIRTHRDASLLNLKKLKVVKKTAISYNFVQIGLKMCKLALAKKLKTGISAPIMWQYHYYDLLNFGQCTTSCSEHFWDDPSFTTITTTTQWPFIDVQIHWIDLENLLLANTTTNMPRIREFFGNF